MIKRYNVENLECAHCAEKMEREIKKLCGVNDAEVNFMLQRITVDFEEDSLKLDKDIQKICKKIEPDCRVLV